MESITKANEIGLKYMDKNKSVGFYSEIMDCQRRGGKKGERIDKERNEALRSLHVNDEIISKPLVSIPKFNAKK